MVKKNEDIAKQARIAVEKWRTYFKTNIDQYHRLHQFVLGKQWEDDEEDMLVKTFNKVPLQFNKLATLANSLLGEQQQNTPQIEIYPLSQCDQETAEVRQNITKDTMLSQDAKTVYQVAAFQAIVGGFGCFIVDTDYVHSHSFDQEIVYRHLKDATRAYWDISAEDISKIDGMRGGYISRMSRQKFKQVYGKDVEEEITTSSKPTASQEEIALVSQPDTSENPFNWADDEGITIIDDYIREMVPDTLYKLSNGRVLNQEEIEALKEESLEFIRNQQMMMGEIDIEPMFDNTEELELITFYDEGQPVRIENQRKIKRSKIMHRKIAGDFILEESEAPCEDIPVIFMDQNSFYDKEGKQNCRPFLIDAVDSQRYLNYLGTQAAYILKISRYDQFIGSKANVKSLDTQNNWKNPNSVKGMITYDESPSGAKPEQLRPPELSNSLMEQYQRAIEDMYTSTGLYPTRIGQQGNEVSGAAIDARTRQGSYSTYVVFNSINRAITAGGKIVNQMIPRVYDTQRVMSLMTPDKGRQNIVVNQQMDEYASRIKNDLTKGTFDVKLQAGPSYEGQKAQALESLNMVLQANPQLLGLIADLYAENLPLTNTLELKNRLKTIVPPQILEAGKTGEMPPQEQQTDPEAQAQMAEAQFKIQQIELKKEELMLKKQELESKIQLEQADMELKHLEYAKDLEEQKLRFLAETDRTRSDNAISHADNITKLLLNNQKQRMSNANVKY